MNAVLKSVFDAHIVKGTHLQIKLRHDSSQQPYGPGKIECVANPDPTGEFSHIYRIMIPAMIQTSPNTPPQPILLPLVFAFEDLLFFSEPPVNAEGDSAIVTPGGGRRTPGGLHIGG